MQERLNLLRLVPKQIMDAGCGEGADLLALHQRYPRADIMGVDASLPMLAVANEAVATAKRGWRQSLNRLFGHGDVQLLQADLAAVSQTSESVDLLWSNLALHWHADPLAVFREWHRLMRMEGALMFSCFGPDTFREVRDAFAGIDDSPHTLDFVDMHHLGDALMAAGFPAPVMDRETLTLTYETAEDLIADVRGFGGLVLVERRTGLMSRAQGRRVMDALDAMRGNDGLVHLTLEVLYGHAFKLEAPQREEGEAVMRFVPRR